MSDFDRLALSGNKEMERMPQVTRIDRRLSKELLGLYLSAFLYQTCLLMLGETHHSVSIAKTSVAVTQNHGACLYARKDSGRGLLVCKTAFVRSESSWSGRDWEGYISPDRGKAHMANVSAE